MKKIIFLAILSGMTFCSMAQKFEVPENIQLEKAEDYALYEEDVKNCIDWLLKTPVQKQSAKRKEASAFLLMWLSGSPNVTIEINADVLPFMESSPDMLIIFLGGWTQAALNSDEKLSMVDGNVAGIEAVLDFYTKNKGQLGKDKSIEKLIKIQQKNELQAHIEAQL